MAKKINKKNCLTSKDIETAAQGVEKWRAYQNRSKPSRESKSILKSKTFWMNIVLAVIVPFIPKEFQTLASDQEVISVLFLGVNVVLRLISKEKVHLI